MSAVPRLRPPSTTGTAGTEGADWARALSRVLRGEGVTSHFQAIVDLQRGSVAGHEALLRFPDHEISSPATWIEAAHALGLGPDLEAVALRSALAALPDLPSDTFLSVNVAPEVLPHPAVREAFLDQPSLAGVVVELTEHTRVEHYGRLAAELDRLRAAGAAIAVDDTGAGYAGLHHLLSIRPEVIKLDRRLVAGIDQDRPQRALVEMFGAFASRFDVQVVAEGVETPGELVMVHQLGVQLAQGYLLARPAPSWRDVSEEARQQLVELAGRPAGTTLRLLLEPPASVWARAEGDGLLRVHVDTGVVEAAHRALNREPAHRFDPVVCVDAAGSLVGHVPMERLVEQLAVLARHDRLAATTPA